MKTNQKMKIENAFIVHSLQFEINSHFFSVPGRVAESHTTSE